MGIVELGGVVFVKNENDLFIFKVGYYFLMMLLADGRMQLLQGGNDQLPFWFGKLFYQVPGVAGGIHAIGRKLVKFFYGLVIEIAAVYAKDHFIYYRQPGQYLAGFKGSKRFARTGGMPDVAIFISFLHPL